MNTTTKTLFILGSAMLSAAALPAQDRIFGDGITPSCMTAVEKDMATLKSMGATSAAIEKSYQQEIAICSGSSSLIAGFAGAANVEYARLAKSVIAKKISAGLYIALQKSVNRKVYQARHNPKWLLEYAKGDADGDLVPDSMDACPATPDLTPTTDNGCPSRAPIPVGPTGEQMDQLNSAMGMTTSKGCDGAMVPDRAQISKAGYDDTAATNVGTIVSKAGSFAFSMRKVSNQPTACPVFYEVETRFSNPISSSVAPDAIVNLVFRESENRDLKNVPGRLVFRAYGTDSGDYRTLFATDQMVEYGNVEIRVRTMNGNGLTSGWGQTFQIKGVPLFQEN